MLFSLICFSLFLFSSLQYISFLTFDINLGHFSPKSLAWSFNKATQRTHRKLSFCYFEQSLSQLKGWCVWVWCLQLNCCFCSCCCLCLVYVWIIHGDHFPSRQPFLFIPLTRVCPTIMRMPSMPMSIKDSYLVFIRESTIDVWYCVLIPFHFLCCLISIAIIQ